MYKTRIFTNLSVYYNYWIGQKVCLSFYINSYEKLEWTLWQTPCIHYLQNHPLIVHPTLNHLGVRQLGTKILAHSHLQTGANTSSPPVMNIRWHLSNSAHTYAEQQNVRAWIWSQMDLAWPKTKKHQRLLVSFWDPEQMKTQNTCSTLIKTFKTVTKGH